MISERFNQDVSFLVTWWIQNGCEPLILIHTRGRRSSGDSKSKSLRAHNFRSRAEVKLTFPGLLLFEFYIFTTFQSCLKLPPASLISSLTSSCRTLPLSVSPFMMLTCLSFLLMGGGAGLSVRRDTIDDVVSGVSVILIKNYGVVCVGPSDPRIWVVP